MGSKAGSGKGRMARHERDRAGSLPPSVIQALLNPVLDEIWLHLLQPVPDERSGPEPPADVTPPADPPGGR